MRRRARSGSDHRGLEARGGEPHASGFRRAGACAAAVIVRIVGPYKWVYVAIAIVSIALVIYDAFK